MAFKGVIFDLNGVLWWDGHLQDRSWGEFSAGLRGTPLSAHEMAVHVHGRNNRYTLEYLTGREVAGAELDELVQRKEAVYRQLCLDQGPEFRLSPGAVELLDWLAGHRIPRTIATASEWTNVSFFVRHLQLDAWFDVGSIVYDDGTRPGKPAPDNYLRAAANLRLPPRQCVVVEDSQSGLQSAHAAGIGYLIALGPAPSHTDLVRRPGVRQVIETLYQIAAEQLFL